MSEIRILLADDHAVIRSGLRLVLEREPGFRVVAEAADGKDAIRLAAELSPDVAVLDVAMPYAGLGLGEWVTCCLERAREERPVELLWWDLSPEWAPFR